ncbi:MAG: ABC transporter permease [Spirochaetaceae bacterium]|nr:ABC transporter permease [Spirochaetaceae bacterium]
MLRYIINRIIEMIPIIIGLSLVLFIFIQLIPGDPISAMLGPQARPGQVEELRHHFGLDRPILVQYFSWVKGVIKGDLGVSLTSRQKITPILIGRIPATLELALGGLFVAVFLGIPAGIIAGIKKNTWIDQLFSLFSLGGLSIPSFWLGTMLLMFLGVKLHILPTGGYIPFLEDPIKNLKYLILPAFSVGFILVPLIARMTRASTIETLQESHVSFARVKGLREKVIIFRYIIRHAIGPVVVVLGLQVRALLGGSMLIEELFLWPGMGRVAIGSVRDRDYFLLQASLLVYALLSMFVNLFADVIHARLDPRIQLK